MHLGATIRLLRLDAGLSLRDLAQRIGVSSAYLSRVEHGHDAVPTPDRLEAIAREIGIPPRLLVGAAHKVGCAIEGYAEDVPSAGMLFLDIARRRLGPAEIARIRAFVEREFPAPERREERPSLARLLAPERVILQLTCPGLEDAIEIAASRFPRLHGEPSVRHVVAELLAREQTASTALGGGVMLPHGVFSPSKTTAALVTLARPLVLPEAPDGLPIRVLLVLLLGEPGGAALSLLAHAARLSSDGLADRLAAATSPADAIRGVEEIEDAG
ncbi:helix-turn-helix domain-containing protein [Polyangium sp. 15x6]|uniref:helix-turn-helix domain-containing protein n=1 Tax=Polyangium sp. 15x6 TaxID=3042687 RepID=UPI00249A20E7|nr:helix-turn-helix domain-containing protein [Polyangium sp. 15x6]MDI3286295.1 PTS sugar transporter subunit IIA [Polyangium sp. 15x6]